jgi:hypothetical protein
MEVAGLWDAYLFISDDGVSRLFRNITTYISNDTAVSPKQYLG